MLVTVKSCGIFIFLYMAWRTSFVHGDRSILEDLAFLILFASAGENLCCIVAWRGVTAVEMIFSPFSP